MVLQFEKDKRAFVPDLNNVALQFLYAVKSPSFCQVTQSVVPAMSVDVSGGTVTINGADVVVSPATVTIPAADPSNDRIDMILVNGSGVLSVVSGTPAALPKTGTYNPLTHLCLARVLVQDGVTTIVNADITDTRIVNSGGLTAGINRFIQTFTSQTSVTVNHNLGDANPVVQVYDNNGEYITPDTIDVTSGNQVVLTFLVATSGSVVVHGGTATDLGTTAYIAVAFTSQTSVNVPHGLGVQYPQVIVYNNSNVQIDPSTYTLTAVDSNNLTVTFGGSTSGRVVVSGGSTATTVFGVKKFSQAFTNSTSINITHNLNTTSPLVMVYDNTGKYVICDVTVVDQNTVTLAFAVSQSGTVEIHGGVQSTSPGAGEADFLPDTDAAYDIGSGTFRWKDLYISGQIIAPSGLDSLGGGFGRIDIQSMAGDAISPPAQGFVGLAPTLDFDATNDEFAYFSFRKPTDLDVTQNVTCEIVFAMQSANTSANVVLVLEANAIANAEDGTPVSVESTTSQTVAVPNTADEYRYLTTSTLQIPSSILTGDQTISCRFSRDANNVNDTALGDFRLISFRLVYGRT